MDSSKWAGTLMFSFNLKWTQRRLVAEQTYTSHWRWSWCSPLFTITSLYCALLWFRLFSLSLSVLHTFTFWDLKCQTERLIKSDLVMQAISWEPADGAKSLVISSRQASKPFDSCQMTRCHFPPVILPPNYAVML